ncbi:hypothetical protein FHG87_001960 [Trinorchestia longiramus]|nr:hypothetical protein FHG87_001960 [Trinorchestia longiramus]
MQPTVVLVQPVDDNPTNKNSLSNEIKLAKALPASTFGNCGIGKITKNLGRNLLVLTIDRHYEDPSELQKITEIGPWKVKCRLPVSQSTSVGVIGPFSEDTSNEDLAEALREAGFNGAVAERIFKSKKKIKTSMFTCIRYSMADGSSLLVESVQSLGINVVMWLQAYLKDKPFKVFMEGTYSSERIAKSGVPRPDDLACYTQHPNLRIATDTLQQQLTALHMKTGQNNRIYK